MTRISTGVAAILFATVAANAQGYLVTDAKVTPGDYKPLTFWDRVWLGASYYTDPATAKKLNMAYSFDGPEFSNDHSKLDAIWNLAKENKVSFGVSDPSKKTFSVVPLSELQKRYTINNAADLMRTLSKDKVMIVYTGQTLLGEASKTPVWQATK